MTALLARGLTSSGAFSMRSLAPNNMRASRGVHEDDGCTATLSGFADYVSPPAYTGTGAPLNSFFNIATDTRQVRLGFALGALPTSPHILRLFGSK